MEGQIEIWGRLEAAIESTIKELTEANCRLKQKIFDLHTIFEISRQLNSVLELEKLLDSILSVCVDQAGSSSAAIVVAAVGQEEELSLWRTQGMNHSPPFPAISTTGHLVETLFRKTRPVIFSELEQILPSASEELVLLRKLKIGVCFPLLSKDKVLGILFLGPRTSKEDYHQADVEFLTTLVNNLAVTLENARLYQRVKSANLEVQKAQNQLAEKEKLAALGELAASLAHEINNPLGIIKNYLALLKQESHKNQASLEYIKVVKEELGRVAKIIQELLNLYQPQKKEEFKPTDVTSVLNQTLDLVQSDFQERRITLEKRIASSPAVISARQEELKQVFLNLLMNSRDFTPPGGKISVMLGQRNGSLEIVFKDSGVGIPEEDLKKVFIPFYTTKEKGKGTGLGLSICRRIIQDHQGTIEAKNLPEGGASFLIRLPLN